MATLKQAGEVSTTELRERVDQLVSAVEDETLDFTEIVSRADAVAELADAETYSDLEQTLMRALQRDSDSEPEEDDGQQEQDQEPPSAQRQQQAEEDGTAEDMTKEELLEQAREANISGRSSMTKEELAQAIEAEESLTKEELLERAREAGIEGRSSMTKDELREALRDGGA
jgi:hypothetical protein